MKKKVLVFAIILSLLFGGMIVAVGKGGEGVVENFDNDSQAEAEEKLTFNTGDGTPDDPYLIEDVHQLQNMSEDFRAHYALASDIDASETKEWNNGSGFEPVGNEDIPFTGSFDGRNHTITDLYINRSADSIGLFNYVGEEGETRNVEMVDVSIIGESVSVDYGSEVGGLIGNNEGTIENSDVTGNVSEGDEVGGLVGYNAGTVNNSSATCNVNGDHRVGGLIGYNGGPVEKSYAAGSVSSNWSQIGGLVGLNSGILNNSYAIGDVSGYNSVGGLVGSNNRLVTNSYSTGDVNGTGNQIGGLLGVNTATVSNTHATGEVMGNSYVGALVGDNSDTIKSSYATGDVNGNNRVGGLVGVNDGGVLASSYATGNVSGQDYVGGLGGSNNWLGTVNNSYATGDVNGQDSVGGLVGENSETIENSYATGNVSGQDYVGGIVGENGDTIKNSYATGNVTGDEVNVGGFVGYNSRTVLNSYSKGEVSGFEYIGGFVGSNDGTVENSFWDIETSNLTWSDGGAGKTTAEMKDIATYTNETTEGLEKAWDFVCNPNHDDRAKNIWYIDDYQEINDGYPFLGWQDVELGKYELTIGSTEGGEVIIPGEDSFEYDQWSEVEVKAEAHENYRFVEWTGNNQTVKDTKSNQTTIKICDNYTLKAEFEKIYELRIDIKGEGAVTPSEGNHTYEEDTVVTIEATPADDWKFVGWTGDSTGRDLTMNVTMDANKGITAHFEEEVEYNLIIHIEGEGAVTPSEGNHTYEEDTIVTVEAKPSEGWKIVEWTGDEIGTNESINITMNSNKTITAVFAEEPDFEVEITHYDDVPMGDKITIEYNVSNKGGLEDSQDIVFSVEGEEGGEIYNHTEENVTVAPGGVYSGKFSWEPGDEGNYNLTVASKDYVDTITVAVMEDDDSGFLSNYWWLIMIFVMIAVIAIGIAIAWNKKKPPPNQFQ